jgi:anthranilate phosphoribosyltransferase
MLADFNRQLEAGQPLDAAQVRVAVAQLTGPEAQVEMKANFLSALTRKGETPEEIAAFVRELRELSVPVSLAESLRGGEILDVVGTGGDRLSTFNISSTSALVCAAAGVVVAKHGNRAITSKSGSADVLEALGIPVEQTPEQAAANLQAHGFTFLFAPRFHPAFKHIAPARKLCAERGQRTIFNFLGPLMNPARPTAMLVGVPRAALCESLARVLQTLGVRRAMVVCGQARQADGAPVCLDEFSTLGPTTVAEFYQDRAFHVSEFTLDGLPLQPATLADLAGGDREHNAALTRSLLRGDERGPKRDAVLLNAGAALFVAGRVRSIAEGWELAGAVIDDGRAWAKLEELKRT